MIDPDLVNLIQLGVLSAGVVIALLEIRNMGQTRRAEVTLQFFNKFTTIEFRELWRHAAYEQQFESNEEWAKKYGPYTNPESYNKWLAIITEFNSFGHILKKGLADLEDIHNFAAPLEIVTIWEKFKPLIEFRRKQYNYPELWESFEYLFNETKKKYPQLTTTSPYQKITYPQLTITS